ncbi:hypothetical protein L596_019432 [Steinernema carpocapsae]|uniref:Uncharacterized protein n=1 Tax=Steinernema carpocapsae TaxID=34508 RepID=A0A4U5MQI4_STECR|nr:hypothetical protein L596_019432 [Steinernema carpocapsae]
MQSLEFHRDDRLDWRRTRVIFFPQQVIIRKIENEKTSSGRSTVVCNPDNYQQMSATHVDGEDSFIVVRMVIKTREAIATNRRAPDRITILGQQRTTQLDASSESEVHRRGRFTVERRRRRGCGRSWRRGAS